MKKIIFLIITMIALMLVSCSYAKDDPISLAKNYDEQGYEVELIVDNEEINDFADEVEIKGKAIYCLVAVTPNDGEDQEKMGVYIYCNDNDSAIKMEEDLEEFVSNNEDYFREDIIRLTVNRKNNVVFIGSENAWEDNQ